jgi:hypothetical protein
LAIEVSAARPSDGIIPLCCEPQIARFQRRSILTNPSFPRRRESIVNCDESFVQADRAVTVNFPLNGDAEITASTHIKKSHPMIGITSAFPLNVDFIGQTCELVQISINSKNCVFAR